MKRLILVLSLFIAIGIVPKVVLATAQANLNVEVQIACPLKDGVHIQYGSGTVISRKGVILTNRHVIQDMDGTFIRYCVVGKSKGLNQAASFSDRLISETKYVSQKTELDVAILYVMNDSNFPFFNIGDSTNSNLDVNTIVEALGFPAYNDLKLTHTEGKFTTSFSIFDDYFEATTYINHGNSGGSAYATNQLVGIPTAILQTPSGQRNFFLKIDSVKQWMSSILGTDYQNSILDYSPSGNAPVISLPADRTPPVIKNAPRDVFWFKSFDDSGNVAKGVYVDNYSPWKDLYVSGAYRNIQISMPRSLFTPWLMDDMDKESGLKSAIYSFSDNIFDVLSKPSQERVITYKKVGKSPLDFEVAELTPIISLPNKAGTYYVNIRFADRSGNISEPYILTYVIDGETFLNLKNVTFYTDSNLQNMIGNYDFDMNSWSEYRYPQYHQYCVTNQKNLYIKWNYSSVYDKYAVAMFNDDVEEMSAAQSIISKKISVVNKNSYSIIGLDKGLNTNDWNGYSICDGTQDKTCGLLGKVSTFLLKPQLSLDSPALEGKNSVIKFAYDPNSKYVLKCGKDDVSAGLNQYKHPYIVLRESKPLVQGKISSDIPKPNIVITRDSAQTNDQFVSDQMKKLVKSDSALTNRLKGSILLQVETLGAAWYLHPVTLRRYYLKDGVTAYEMLRSFGLGVSESDYSKLVNGNEAIKNQLSGRIILRVQAHGEAYYINPKDLSVTYLKDGEVAYQAMRNLSLGITDVDIAKILIENFVPSK